MEAAYDSLTENLRAAFGVSADCKVAPPDNSSAFFCCGLVARADVGGDDVFPECWPDLSIDDEIVDGFPNVTGLTPLVARERIRSYLPTVVNDAKRQRSAQ